MSGQSQAQEGPGGGPPLAGESFGPGGSGFRLSARQLEDRERLRRLAEPERRRIILEELVLGHDGHWYLTPPQIRLLGRTEDRGIHIGVSSLRQDAVYRRFHTQRECRGLLYLVYVYRAEDKHLQDYGFNAQGEIVGQLSGREPGGKGRVDLALVGEADKAAVERAVAGVFAVLEELYLRRPSALEVVAEMERVPQLEEKHAHGRGFGDREMEELQEAGNRLNFYGYLMADRLHAAARRVGGIIEAERQRREREMHRQYDELSRKRDAGQELSAEERRRLRLISSWLSSDH